MSTTAKPTPSIVPALNLVSAGMKLVKLHPYEKRPMGEKWNTNSDIFVTVATFDHKATGYGLPLVINGLVSIDPDNVELAAKGLAAIGFDLEELMSAGVRTTSTRPQSGGRSTFADPQGLRWLKFSSKDTGTVLELRATSMNLQDVVAGAVYRSKDGEHYYKQEYVNGKTHADAKDTPLPKDFEAFWRKCSEDVEFYREAQRVFFEAIGVKPHLAVSSGSVDGKLSLAHASQHRGAFNRAHSVEEILERHGYSQSVDGRYAPPTATGAPAVRLIPNKDGLWQSDHASDPLHGTFDAWIAHVQLDHDGDLDAAEAEAHAQREAKAIKDFQVLAPDESLLVLPAFERNGKSKIIANRNNLMLALKADQICGMKIGLDTFTGNVAIDDHGSGAWRAFTDADYSELALRLESGQNGFVSIPSPILREMVYYVASVRSVDSARVWLDGLRWDGAPRIEQSMIKYFGAQDSPYIRAVGTYLFTALAGRVIDAGVQADMVVAVVGAQGAKKSTTVASIAPTPSTFMELDLSEKDADLARKMRGKLVIELGELVGMGRKAKEELKAFITRKHELWIPKFKEFEQSYPRRNVFIATTNTAQFLSDETGNRRWLPFDCGECAPEAMAHDREQLWAEGAVSYRRSGIAWQDAQRLAVGEHDQYVEHDGWTDQVCNYLNTSGVGLDGEVLLSPIERGSVTVTEILAGALDIRGGHQSNHHSQRVQRILRQNGWVSSGKAVRVTTDEGTTNRAKYWTPKSPK